MPKTKINQETAQRLLDDDSERNRTLEHQHQNRLKEGPQESFLLPPTRPEDGANFNVQMEEFRLNTLRHSVTIFYELEELTPEISNKPALMRCHTVYFAFQPEVIIYVAEGRSNNGLISLSDLNYNPSFQRVASLPQNMEELKGYKQLVLELLESRKHIFPQKVFNGDSAVFWNRLSYSNLYMGIDHKRKMLLERKYELSMMTRDAAFAAKSDELESMIKQLEIEIENEQKFLNDVINPFREFQIKLSWRDSIEDFQQLRILTDKNDLTSPASYTSDKDGQPRLSSDAMLNLIERLNKQAALRYALIAFVYRETSRVERDCKRAAHLIHECHKALASSQQEFSSNLQRAFSQAQIEYEWNQDLTGEGNVWSAACSRHQLQVLRLALQPGVVGYNNAKGETNDIPKAAENYHSDQFPHLDALGNDIAAIRSRLKDISENRGDEDSVNNPRAKLLLSPPKKESTSSNNAGNKPSYGMMELSLFIIALILLKLRFPAPVAPLAFLIPGAAAKNAKNCEEASGAENSEEHIQPEILAKNADKNENADKNRENANSSANHQGKFNFFTPGSPHAVIVSALTDKKIVSETAATFLIKPFDGFDANLMLVVVLWRMMNQFYQWATGVVKANISEDASSKAKSVWLSEEQKKQELLKLEQRFEQFKRDLTTAKNKNPDFDKITAQKNNPVLFRYYTSEIAEGLQELASQKMISEDQLLTVESMLEGAERDLQEARVISCATDAPAKSQVKQPISWSLWSSNPAAPPQNASVISLSGNVRRLN